MAESVNIAVDAMGGDNAPAEIVKGAVEAIEKTRDMKIFLVGKEDAVRAELAKYTYDPDRIEVVHASEVIEMAEPPVMAVRTKKDSSLVRCMYMVKPCLPQGLQVLSPKTKPTSRQKLPAVHQRPGPSRQSHL